MASAVSFRADTVGVIEGKSGMVGVTMPTAVTSASDIEFHYDVSNERPG